MPHHGSRMLGALAAGVIAAAGACGTTRAADAGLDFRLVTPATTFAPRATASAELIVLNRSSEPATVALPATFEGTIAAGARRWPVSIRRVGGDLSGAILPGGFQLVTLSFELPEDVTGAAELTMEEPAPLRAGFALVR
jgi:hypothetical protein